MLHKLSKKDFSNEFILKDKFGIREKGLVLKMEI